MNTDKLSKSLFKTLDKFIENHKVAAALGTLYGLILDLCRGFFNPLLQKANLSISNLSTFALILLGFGIFLPISILINALSRLFKKRDRIEKIVYFMQELKNLEIMDTLEIKKISRELIQSEMDQEAIDRAYKLLDEAQLKVNNP